MIEHQHQTKESLECRPVKLIKIYIYIHMSSSNCQGTSLELHHIFSVERDNKKRAFILKEHRAKHVFGDVVAFQESEAWCYVTKKNVAINEETLGVDLLLAGTSCKDLSTLSTKRAEHAGCYEDQPVEDGADDGVSGPTYKYGFRQAGSRRKECIKICWFYTPIRKDTRHIKRDKLATNLSVHIAHACSEQFSQIT